jgi:hypothetical protein
MFKGALMKRKIYGFFPILLVFGIAVFLTSCKQEVPNQTPVADDYTFGNLSQTAGSVTAVTITAKNGKSPGTVSNIRYTGSPMIPQTAGSYAVTFDVAAASGWNAATGLYAGSLTVNAVEEPVQTPAQTPVAGDYTFGNLNQTAESVTAVTITPNSGKSPGAITIYYTGTGATTYDNSATIPQTTGTYAVTFDVAEAEGWNPATGLSAGNLVVNPVGVVPQTPVPGDFTIGNLSQTVGSVTPVTITANPGKSTGAVSNIKYDNSATIPQTAGTYAVTFDVAAAPGWNPATALSAGTLTVTPASSGGDTDTDVALIGVATDGSEWANSTLLLLMFDKDIEGLSVDNITLSGMSGVSKGTLTEIEPYYYSLGLSGITGGGNLSVAVAKSGYTISGSPKTVAIFYNGSGGGDGDTAVTFNSVTANGSSSEITTQLTLTFSQAIAGLSAEDITLNGVPGVSKGTLSGSGPAYTLGISGFTSGGTLSVAAAKTGFVISGSPKTVAIYYGSSAPTPDGSSRENAIPLTENIWADGELLTMESTQFYSDAQWFKFIATAASQYIHCSFGTLSPTNNLIVQVYDSNDNEVGNEIDNFGSSKRYDVWDVSPGGDYYVRVRSYGTGDYQIGFNGSTMRPGLRTELVLDKWTDGNIATANGEQWFKFTATASTHYIHFAFGGVNGVNVRLYDSSGNEVDNVGYLSTVTTSISRTTTVGQEYQIQVTPAAAGGTGSYKIGFNTSSVGPDISWTHVTSSSFSPYAIAFGNGRFVAVGSGSQSAYSTNGISWIEVSISSVVNAGFLNIAYSNPKFLAVSSTGLTVESSDGTSWSFIINNTFDSTAINSTVYGNGYFVAVGDSGKAARMYNSLLANEWTVVDVKFGTSNIYDITYGDGKFVAVGQAGKAAYSSDGMTWTAVSDMQFGTSGINGIAYGDGKFVAVGNGGKAAYSNDGITWTAVNDMAFGNTSIEDIAYGGGKFVAVGQAGKAAYSSDGITWAVVDVTTLGNQTIRTITYGGQKFVAGGEGGMAYWDTP